MSSVENALNILSLLNTGRPILRVGEVCRELKIPKSSVSRLLRTLSDYGLLERQLHDHGYVAGARALALSDLFLARHSLLDAINIGVERLFEEFGFVGYVGVLQGPDLVILRLKHGSYPLRLVQDVGKQFPAFRTAIGQALLAKRPSAEALALAATDKDIKSAGSAVARELDAVRRTGIAQTTSTVVPGIAAIGAAVHDPRRNEALGFSLSFPITGADKALQRRMCEAVSREARLIGSRCGDPDWTAASQAAQTVARSKPDRVRAAAE